ncbi:MAG: cupin domain-containing protein [Chitinophagaceae bacterium]|nr:cupin domain-containing protein [Chitinophagaceae bacterium]
MEKQNSFQHEEKGSWIKVVPGVERMIMGYDENLMMVKVKFEKNAVGPLHFHPHLQSTYIAKGSFEVTINDKTSLLHEGDTFFVGSNLVHGVVCVEEGILIDAFNPARKDFL